MFSRFFIDRPIFASVLSIVIALAGVLAIFNLPLSQYPLVAPPTVQVQCSYPGASAQVVAETVAAPIEQQVNGVEKMLYMQSSCTNDGAYSLAVTFEQGVNMNMAQVLVQNRVNLAMPLLPDVIKQSGVTMRKQSPDIVKVINFNSPSGRYNQLYLSNFVFTRVRDEMLRVEGVGDVFLIGQRDYSMRIWVDPDKLSARGLTTDDLVNAIREQNTEVACGYIGQEPAKPGQQTQIKLSTLGRLSKPEEFADIVVRVTPDGRIMRLKDVARLELGAKSVDVSCTLDGKPSAGLAIFQLPDANALELDDRITAKMRELEPTFPEGVTWETQYDSTPYTRQCISEVIYALVVAIVLVAFVVLLFLQNWRSALIPLVAVPVAILGTFAVMLAMGFTLNNLTLFGLVLAIGIVVDDAIVVVEAVEHHIEHGMQPREATIKAMSQVSGPVIAVGLVLSAVFVPCAFISGVTGQFFRQFALTIAASTIISCFNSLTLSPALAALLLRPRNRETHEPLPRCAFWLVSPVVLAVWLAIWGRDSFRDWLGGLVSQNLPYRAELLAAAPWLLPFAVAAVGWLIARPAIAALGWLFRLFNRGFNAATCWYIRAVGMLLRVSVLVLVIYGGMLVATWWGFVSTPKGFVPQQDMGYMIVNVQLPDASSIQRTREATALSQKICMQTPGVAHTLGVSGMSFLNQATSSIFGSMFVILDDFENRRSPGRSVDAIAQSLRMAYQKEIPEAVVTVLPAAPIRGVGRTGGFTFVVEHRDGADLKALQDLQTAIDDFVVKGNQLTAPGGMPLFVAPLNTVFRANAPQLFVDLNRAQCMTQGVLFPAAANTLQVYLGSLYVNNFNLLDRTWQVIVQADAKFRNNVEQVKRLTVRNSSGKMVPIGSIAEVRGINGPLMYTRYNMKAAGQIRGQAGPGIGSRETYALIQKLADDNLPRSMQTEWTEMAFLELQAADTAMLIFGLSTIAVFLVLAAQYESWSLPLAVIFVVPMCILSAIIGVHVMPMLLPESLVGPNPLIDINIFTEIGFVVLLGLASKNAILIVEFAKRQREEGFSRREAALSACKLRLRPIVMTSFAFILGVFPLLIGRGAGAEMRRTLGIAVFSGMLGVTVFGIFLTPVFFNVIDWLGSARIFHSRTWRMIRFLTLGIFAFGFVRVAIQKGLAPRKAPAGNPPAGTEPAEEDLDEITELETIAEGQDMTSVGPGR
jgi:multidrug efflux pump subunit AcrB